MVLSSTTIAYSNVKLIHISRLFSKFTQRIVVWQSEIRYSRCYKCAGEHLA